MQHSNNGAVLGATGGAGRGRRVPGPSPALISNYTNSPASTPSAEPKGPALPYREIVIGYTASIFRSLQIELHRFIVCISQEGAPLPRNKEEIEAT